MLKDKTVVMGITGGIAAYKAIEVVRLLKKSHAAVHIIMTSSAAKFITPLTFREISGNPVITSLWEEPVHWNVEHISLATMADLFLIAPATANIIGKIANGIGDDMLSTTVMATKAPVVLSPAMNTNMYENPIVQQNIQKLSALGYHIIKPSTGLMACGTEGIGRLPEPSEIAGEVTRLLTLRHSLHNQFAGKKFLVTAGGTREPIDPVRFIGNRSSGKMGFALAQAAAARGAEVVLISGTSSLATPVGKIKRINVETAEEMRQAVLAEFATIDVVIKAAAVSDYRPQTTQTQKLKKSTDTLSLTLVKNADILLELGQKKSNQLLIGFAAETQDLLANAADKLTRKNLDLLIANDVTMQGAGFSIDTNIVKILHRNGQIEEFPQLPKQQVAEIILDKIYALL